MDPGAKTSNRYFSFSIASSACKSFGSPYHDFSRLQVAFEDVWAELLDQRIQQAGEQLYAAWDALMDPSVEAESASDAPHASSNGDDVFVRFGTGFQTGGATIVHNARATLHSSLQRARATVAAQAKLASEDP
jgi:hypothetical protein